MASAARSSRTQNDGMTNIAFNELVEDHKIATSFLKASKAALMAQLKLTNERLEEINERKNKINKSKIELKKSKEPQHQLKLQG